MEVHQREWHWFDWITVSMRTVFYFFFFVSMHADVELILPTLKGYPYWLSLQGLPYGFTFGLLLFSFFISFLFWNPWGVQQLYGYRVELLMITVLLLCSFIIDLRYAHLLPLLSLQFGFIGPKEKVPWSLTAMFLFIFIMGWYQNEVDLYSYFFYGFYCYLTFGYAYVFQRVIVSEQESKKLLVENREQYRLIQEKNKALVQYAKQIEKMTIIEERNRVASELHDTVGHTLTSVIMGLDAVSYLLETSPEKAKEKIDILREVMRNGLEEVRQNIHQMADENPDLLSIQMLIIANEFSAHTGTKTKVETKGDEIEVSKPIRWALIRCLQESLTNAKRHGQAMRVNITLSFTPQYVKLSVADDGVGAKEVTWGFGLTTMKERLRSLNGDFQVRTTPGKGMTVICTLPKGGEYDEHEAASRR